MYGTEELGRQSIVERDVTMISWWSMRDGETTAVAYLKSQSPDSPDYE